MKGNRNIYVVVAESSTIVRSGLVAVLNRIPSFNIQATEVASMEALHHTLRSHEVDIVIINPTFGGTFKLAEFKSLYSHKNVKYAAIITNLIDESYLKEFDGKIHLFDELDEISTTLINMIQVEEDNNESELEALSQREKEIVCYVVKGFINKEIAKKLYISVNTVITHRRNISRKLQIHSPAGLTIYAIVNKLVDIKDVNLH